MTCYTYGRVWVTTPEHATCIAPHACIRDEFDGEFPKTFEQVASLPGIGRSTAGAILALSRGRAISDPRRQRQARAVAIFRGGGERHERAVSDRLWQLADACTPAKESMSIPRRSWIWGRRSVPAASLCVPTALVAKDVLRQSDGQPERASITAGREGRETAREDFHVRRDARGRQRSARAPARNGNLGRALVPAGV